MKKTIISFFLFSLINLSFAKGELPKDILDANVAFAISESHQCKDLADLKSTCEQTLIDLGFNLVLSDVVTQKGVREEFKVDYKNKEVKYIILLQYMIRSDVSSYALYITTAEATPDFTRPNEHFYAVGSNYTVDKTLSKLEKEINSFKADNPDADKTDYDRTLINRRVFSDADVAELERKQEVLTVLDNAAEIKHEQLPEDLSTSAIAIVNVQNGENDGSNYINNQMQSSMKDYPYEYKIFENYSEFEAANKDGKYKYRIILVKKRATIVTEKLKDNNTISSTTWNKDLYFVTLKNLETKELYLGSNRDFIKFSMKMFVENVK